MLAPEREAYMYIIVRTDGAFVSRPGSEHSYTKQLQHACVYNTRAQAEADRCPENETVWSIDEYMEARGK